MKCKRCNGKILVKTFNRYKGYSRQCLKKITENKNPEVSVKVQDLILRQQMKERLTAVLPQERVLYRTDNWVWTKNFQNQIVMSEA